MAGVEALDEAVCLVEVCVCREQGCDDRGLELALVHDRYLTGVLLLDARTEGTLKWHPTMRIVCCARPRTSARRSCGTCRSETILEVSCDDDAGLCGGSEVEGPLGEVGEQIKRFL